MVLRSFFVFVARWMHVNRRTKILGVRNLLCSEPPIEDRMPASPIKMYEVIGLTGRAEKMLRSISKGLKLVWGCGYGLRSHCVMGGLPITDYVPITSPGL